MSVKVTAAEMADLCEAVKPVPEMYRIARTMCTELDALRAVAVAAQAFIERTADITEEHPAYGFVVMGIPLAKALAAASR